MREKNRFITFIFSLVFFIVLAGILIGYFSQVGEKPENEIYISYVYNNSIRDWEPIGAYETFEEADEIASQIIEANPSRYTSSDVETIPMNPHINLDRFI